MAWRSRLCSLLAVVAVAGLVSVTAFDDPVGSTDRATADTGRFDAAEIGALFVGGAQTCTASVVHSPAGNLILTAAHCVSGRDAGEVSFVPGYGQDTEAHGSWTGDRIFAARGWIDNGDEDLDFAFVTVHQQGATRSLESLTGANVLTTGSGFDNRVTVAGYPSSSRSLLTCTQQTTQQDDYQLRVECPGYPGGTSGSPWICGANPQTGVGKVIGVIGGFEDGGSTEDISYASYFDEDITALYAQATALRTR